MTPGPKNARPAVQLQPKVIWIYYINTLIICELMVTVLGFLAPLADDHDSLWYDAPSIVSLFF